MKRIAVLLLASCMLLQVPAYADTVTTKPPSAWDGFIDAGKALLGIGPSKDPLSTKVPAEYTENANNTLIEKDATVVGDPGDGTGAEGQNYNDVPDLSVLANSKTVKVNGQSSPKPLSAKPIYEDERLMASNEVWMIGNSAITSTTAQEKAVRYLPVFNPGHAWYGWFIPASSMPDDIRPAWDWSSCANPCEVAQLRESFKDDPAGLAAAIKEKTKEFTDKYKRYKVKTTTQLHRDNDYLGWYSYEFFVKWDEDYTAASFKPLNTGYIFYHLMSTDITVAALDGYSAQPMRWDAATKTPLFDVKLFGAMNNYYMSFVDGSKKEFGFKSFSASEVASRGTYVKTVLAKGVGAPQKTICKYTKTDADGNDVEVVLDSELFNEEPGTTIPAVIKDQAPPGGYYFNHNQNLMAMATMKDILSTLKLGGKQEEATFGFAEEQRIIPKNTLFDENKLTALVAEFEAVNWANVVPSTLYPQYITTHDSYFIVPVRDLSSVRKDGAVTLDDVAAGMRNDLYVSGDGATKVKVFTQGNPYSASLFLVACERLHSQLIKEYVGSGLVDKKQVMSDAIIFVDNYGNLLARQQHYNSDEVKYYPLFPNYLNTMFVEKPYIESKFSAQLFTVPGYSDGVYDVLEDNVQRSIVTYTTTENAQTAWFVAWPVQKSFMGTTNGRVLVDLAHLFASQTFLDFSSKAVLTQTNLEELGDAKFLRIAENSTNGLTGKDFYVFEPSVTAQTGYNAYCELITKTNASRSSISKDYIQKLQVDITANQNKPGSSAIKYRSTMGWLVQGIRTVSGAFGALLVLFNLLAFLIYHAVKSQYFFTSDWAKKLTLGLYTIQMTKKAAWTKFLQVFAIGAIALMAGYYTVLLTLMSFLSKILGGVS